MTNRGEIGDPCDLGNPLSWTVGGQELAIPGLAFTPGFPCGVELDATATAVAPLKVLATWSGCVGDRPGDVLLSGHVQARVRTAVGITRFGPFQDCIGVTSAPRVKLRVTSCKLPGPVIIDSDSPLVIPSGAVTIELLGPSTWRLMGEQTLALATQWTDVAIKVTACPLTDYVPRGVLTAWAPVDVALAADRRIFVRPRRARTLSLAGTLLPAVTLRWQQVATALAPGFGAVAMPPATVLELDNFGGLPFFSLEAVTPFTALMVWGIE